MISPTVNQLRRQLQRPASILCINENYYIGLRKTPQLGRFARARVLRAWEYDIVTSLYSYPTRFSSKTVSAKVEPMHRRLNTTSRTCFSWPEAYLSHLSLALRGRLSP